MKRIGLWTTILGTSALFCAAGLAQAATHHHSSTQKEEQAVENAKVSLGQAISKAEEQGNGKAVSAEYDMKDSTAGYYEVKVLSNDGKKLTRYRLDPNTGKITDTADEPMQKMFTRLNPTSLQNAQTSLKSAISTAEQTAGGKAIGASVNRGGDQLEYTVKVAKADGSTDKVTINGSNGRVASK